MLLVQECNSWNFADEIEKANVTQAIGSLNKALTALSSAVSGCGVQEVQTKLDAIARAISLRISIRKGLIRL